MYTQTSFLTFHQRSPNSFFFPTKRTTNMVAFKSQNSTHTQSQIPQQFPGLLYSAVGIMPHSLKSSCEGSKLSPEGLGGLFVITTRYTYMGFAEPASLWPPWHSFCCPPQPICCACAQGVASFGSKTSSPKVSVSVCCLLNLQRFLLKTPVLLLNLSLPHLTSVHCHRFPTFFVAWRPNYVLVHFSALLALP